MVTGWQYIGNAWYYFGGSGAMQTGWLNLYGTWYHFNDGGAMQTGWQSIGGSWYYFDGSGAMVTGWRQVNGTWYYFYDSGAMATNTRVGDSYVNGSGAWVPGHGQSSGGSGSTDSWDGRTAYVSPYGKYWHKSPNCSKLNHASNVSAVSVGNVGNRKECPYC